MSVTAHLDLSVSWRDLPPGPELAFALMLTVGQDLLPGERVDVAAAWGRQVAWTEAQALDALAPAVKPEPGGEDWAVDLVQVGLGLGKPDAAIRVNLARELAGRSGATHAALAAGRISLAHAQVLVEELMSLDDPTHAAVEQELLAQAPDLLPVTLTRRARRAVVAADPAQARDKQETARDQRGAWLRPLGGGRSELGLVGPHEQVAAAWAAINNAADQHAAEDKAAGDERTACQRRFDTAIDLITGGGTPRTELVVRCERDDLGPVLGEVFGEPVPTPLLDMLLATCTVRWHHPTRPPAPTDGYRPSAALARWIRQQDRHCQFPGCTVPATNCDLDHVIPWSAGGTTSADNLICLCRHHHRLKHESGWTLILQPGRVPRWRAPTRVPAHRRVAGAQRLCAAT